MSNLKSSLNSLTVAHRTLNRKLTALQEGMDEAESELHTAVDAFDGTGSKRRRCARALRAYSKIFKRFDKVLAAKNIVKARLDLTTDSIRAQESRAAK